jgi:serine/threonine-protein phosphatase 6 regulatory subunit 3
VEKKRTFKFPFIACEIFTCEIEMILKTLVEDEELMLLLFSFLEAKETHNSLLAGYFSKVVICLLVRKTIPFMQFIKDHQEILKQLVDLIGITSIMEVGLHFYMPCWNSLLGSTFITHQLENILNMIRLREQ